jgi:molecular chaperone DnaK (HSP70)
MDLLDSCLDKLILDAKENVAAQTKPKGLVFAIDFGTTYSGVAFTRTPVYIPDDNSNEVAQLNDLKDLDRAVDVVRTWPMPDYTCVEKTPTVLAYSGNQVDGYKLESWGGKAKNSGNIRIEYFKLGLRDKPTEKFSQTASGGFILHGFATDPTWRHPNFPDLSALDYTTAFLTKLYRYVLEEVIPLQFGTEFLSKHPIYIVLTVPAIWSETAKNLTRTAAILAGIPKQRLELITEPEAAALYCATMVEQVDLKEGDCFVVCDAGGGTVVSLFDSKTNPCRI